MTVKYEVVLSFLFDEVLLTSKTLDNTNISRNISVGSGTLSQHHRLLPVLLKLTALGHARSET